ncbi:MAG: hypothetical protein IJF83_10985 [Methanobrevibacter sp.]|nr:hypothetical protein [Methanobrevibacter sp.]
MVNPFDNATNITLNNKTVVRITTSDGGVIYDKPKLGFLSKTITAQFLGDENDISTRPRSIGATFWVNGDIYEQVTLKRVNDWTATIRVPEDYDVLFNCSWTIRSVEGYDIEQTTNGDTTILVCTYTGSSPK